MPPAHVLGIAHVVALGLWGGVVATEAVVELFPFRRRALHEQAIRFHYWIDLLVELPVLLAVLGTGLLLVVSLWPLSDLHLLKLGLVSVAFLANVVCIVLVLLRRRHLEAGVGEAALWRETRRILACFAVGLPFAAAGACLGFWLAFQRMVGTPFG